jgi:hypothetical protein
MDILNYKMQKESYQIERKYGNKLGTVGNFLGRNIDSYDV